MNKGMSIKVIEDVLTDESKVYGVEISDGENTIRFDCPSIRDAYDCYHKMAGAIQYSKLNGEADYLTWTLRFNLAAFMV